MGIGGGVCFRLVMLLSLEKFDSLFIYFLYKQFSGLATSLWQSPKFECPSAAGRQTPSSRGGQGMGGGEAPASSQASQLSNLPRSS